MTTHPLHHGPGPGLEHDAVPAAEVDEVLLLEVRVRLVLKDRRPVLLGVLPEEGGGGGGGIAWSGNRIHPRDYLPLPVPD